MKIRLYKLASGEVVVDCPSNTFQADISKCPHPWRFRESNPDKEGFELEIMDRDALEAMSPGNEGGSGQFYVENGEVKHDDKWQNCIMPKSIIRDKEERRLQKELDDALEAGDSLKALKAQRGREKLKDASEKELLELALSKLPPEKGKVRAKLEKRLGKKS